MAKKKKKAITPDEKFSNGMYKERTRQAGIQGAILLAFMFLLNVFAYIACMLPGPIFTLITLKKGSMYSQTVYDVENILMAIIGLVICVIGGWVFAKKTGENDALYAFQNKQERTMDKRYLLLSVCGAVLVYFIVAVLMNVEFFSGPIKYVAILISREEQKLNEKVAPAFIFRLISGLIVLALETPLMFKGVFDGFKQKMAALEAEEKEAAEEAARRAAEEAAKTK